VEPEREMPLMNLHPRGLRPWNDLVVDVTDRRVVDEDAGPRCQPGFGEEIERSDVRPMNQSRKERHACRNDDPEQAEDIRPTRA
jgi:hypothetical protein